MPGRVLNDAAVDERKMVLRDVLDWLDSQLVVIATLLFVQCAHSSSSPKSVTLISQGTPRLQ